MAITVEALRLAMTAVQEATPQTRRQRITELMTAGVEMTELVEAHERQLKEDDAWLEDDLNRDDPTYVKRETRYLRRLVWYQEEHAVLGEALLMIKEIARGKLEMAP